MKQLKEKRKIAGTILMLFCLLFAGRAFAQQIQEPEMVFVPGGTFTMGCTFEQGSDCSSDEKPSHEVVLTGFAIAKYEVTQALWKSVMGNNPSLHKGDNLPVENVSWDEVQVFIQRLNEKTGKSYRLPTEAEWEYAARGANQSGQTQFAGGFDLESVAWCSLNSDNLTHEVGSKKANELGLYDMSGNVWEWCGDLYGQYSADKETNPTGAKKGASRILRGGCYAAIDKQCRVSARKTLYQGGKDNMTGFRLAMNDDREAQAAAAAAAAEAQRIAAEKAAVEAAKKAEQERIAAEKAAEQERIAQEKAAAEAAKKAEQERIAAERAEAEAARKTEQERIAAEQAAIRKQKVAVRNERLASIPNSVFFTVNGEMSTMPQWGVGFKVGTMKNVGWYFSVLTNFNYKGMFKNFNENNVYDLTGVSKSSYLEALVGVTARRYKPVSFHFGVGFNYRTLNFETDQGWLSYTKNTYYGPVVATGLMFHIHSFVLSLEGVGSYNLNPNCARKFSLGGNLGVGFCIPIKKNNK